MNLSEIPLLAWLLFAGIGWYLWRQREKRKAAQRLKVLPPVTFSRVPTTTDEADLVPSEAPPVEAPAAKKMKPEVKEGPVVIISAVIMVVGFLWYQFAKEPSVPAAPREPQAVVHNSAWNGSVRQVERWMQQNLHDPKSFKAVEWGQVVEVPAGGFIVRVKYRAKNAFGSTVLNHQRFVFDDAGNIVDVHDIKQ